MAAYIIETLNFEDDALFRAAFPDAKELIRCKDCKYGIKARRAGEDRVQCCLSDFDLFYPLADHFCGYARTKGGRDEAD